MLKSSTYVFLLIVAGALVLLAAMSIPLVFTDDLGTDMQEDLFRARQTVLDQYKLRAYEQVVAAQSGASKRDLVKAVAPIPPPPPADGDFAEPAPDPKPDTNTIDNIIGQLAKELRQDLVVVLDAKGKVLGTNNAEGPTKPGEDLAGLPAVKDALNGQMRDGIWIVKPGHTILMLGSSPLIAQRDGKFQVVGAILVGDKLDANLTAQLGEQLNPAKRSGYSVNVAFVHNGRTVASSTNDNELKDVIDGLAGKVKTHKRLPTTTSKGYYDTLKTESYNRQVGTLMTALGEGQESLRIGVVVLAERPEIITDLMALLPQALTLDDNRVVVNNAWLIGGGALVLFLLGLLLITNEHTRPGRNMLRQLQDINNDVEAKQFNTKKLHGVYNDVGLEIQKAITILRKRLEHEREAKHSAEDALQNNNAFPGSEPIEIANEPRFKPSPTPLRPAPQTFKDEPPPEPLSDPTEEHGTAMSSGLWKRPRIGGLASSDAPVSSGPMPIPLGESILKPLVVPTDSVPIGLDSRIDLKAFQNDMLSSVPTREPAAPEAVANLDLDNVPKDELANLFQALAGEEDPNQPFVADSLNASLDSDHAPTQVVHDAPEPDNVPESGWTNIGLGAIPEENSANKVVATLEPSTDNPETLSPQSLLETLKKRSATAAPRSGLIPALITTENTQVRRVDPEDLRKSSTQAAVRPAEETPSSSNIQKLSEEEQVELRELFQSFIETKESCGEPTEGLTIKRFAKRVINNRRKLVEQYNCRTVRFQVYVKNGKAALKATPLK